MLNPSFDDLAGKITNWKERRYHRFGKLRPNLARILVDPPLRQIDMLEPQRGNRVVSAASKDGEGNQGPIAELDICVRRHHAEHVIDLFEGGNAFRRLRFRDPTLLLGEIEVVRIAIAQAGAIAWPAGQPVKEIPQCH